MVSDKQLSREISSLCRRIIVRLDGYELERGKASERGNEARLNHLSEVVNGDVSQKNEYVGESSRANGVYKGGSMYKYRVESCLGVISGRGNY